MLHLRCDLLVFLSWNGMLCSHWCASFFLYFNCFLYCYFLFSSSLFLFIPPPPHVFLNCFFPYFLICFVFFFRVPLLFICIFFNLRRFLFFLFIFLSFPSHSLVLPYYLVYCWSFVIIISAQHACMWIVVLLKLRLCIPSLTTLLPRYLILHRK